MFRKYNMLLRRCGSLLIVCSVLMTFFVGSASASDLSLRLSVSSVFRYGNAYARSTYGGSSSDFNLPLSNFNWNGGSLSLSFAGDFYSASNFRSIGLERLDMPFLSSSGSAAGFIQVYFSGYCPLIRFNPGRLSTNEEWVSKPPLISSGTAELHYTNAGGIEGATASFPVQSYDLNGYSGIVVKLSTVASEIEPLKNFSVLFPTPPTWGTPGVSNSGTVSSSVSVNCTTFGYFYFTSVRVLASASTLEAQQLQGVADSIAQQNQAAQAFYGDIMAVLQAIADHQSNIDSTLGVLQEQIVTMLNKITSLDGNVSTLVALATQYLHYLESIATTSENILSELQSFHADFITKLDLLTSTIVTESGNVQDKMDEIYELLIAYLDSQFASAVPDVMPGQISDMNTAIVNQEQMESQWIGNMASQWQDLGITDWSLAPTLVSGVMWVSSWFTNFINATGDFKMILTLPMLLGIVMLIVGMISRSGGRGGSSKDYKSDSSQ